MYIVSFYKTVKKDDLWLQFGDIKGFGHRKQTVCIAGSEISNVVVVFSSCNLAHSILNLDFYGDNNLSIGICFKYHVNELAKQKYSYRLFRENSDSTTEPSLELKTSFGTQETSEVS